MRRAPALVASAAWILTVGCLGVDHLDAPPDLGAAAVVLVVHDARGDALYAADVETTLAAALPPLVLDGDREVRVIELGCSLAVLGFPRGPLAITGAPTTDLPPVLARYVLRPGTTTWAAEADLPDGVKALLTHVALARPAGCPTLTTVEVPGPLEYGVGLADGAVLASAAGGAFYRVARDRAPQRLPLLSGRYLAAHRRGDELWLVGAFGNVAHGRADTGLEAVLGASTERVDALWLAGADASAPFELLRLDQRGRFDYLASGGWLPAVDPLTAAGGTLATGGLVWNGPGEAIAIGGRRLVRYMRGQVPFTLEVEGAELTTIANLGPYVAVGRASGEILLFREDRLDHAENLPAAEPVRGLVRLGSGVVGLSPSGVAYWQSGFRACFEPPLTGLAVVGDMATSSTAAILGPSSVSFLDAPADDGRRACGLPR